MQEATAGDLLVAFRDITEMREADTKRRALEHQLHHSQKLDALGTLAPPVLGDSTQIHQVVINLVTNAVHAIGMGHGTISISLAAVSSPGNGEHGLVRLTVADTGCGMHEETQRRIFDPFFTTKAVGESTGLGLSVVHGIVSNHHGTIAVESALGRGTRFVVDLPTATHETEIADQRSVA